MVVHRSPPPPLVVAVVAPPPARLLVMRDTVWWRAWCTTCGWTVQRPAEHVLALITEVRLHQREAPTHVLRTERLSGASEPR